MSKPLFTEQEIKARALELKNIEDEHYKRHEIQYDEMSSKREALRRAQDLETAKRVRARATEFLDMLTIIVGGRGATFVNFEKAFAVTDGAEFRECFQKNDSPEARRALYTVLRALTEVPKTWAGSAIGRFLKGTGKQRGASYHGAGTFGPSYGWKGAEVDAVIRVVAGRWDSFAAKILMSYMDVEAEARKSDPDFEVIDQQAARFEAVQAERDVEFLKELCEMLEKRGLAPIPEGKPLKILAPHVPKVFKPGDIIRLKNLRDLPLPAHVRIPVEKGNYRDDKWEAGTIEQVVVRIGKQGHYYRYQIANGEAYAGGGIDWEDKKLIDGATYLGSWKGKVVTGKELRFKFSYRSPKKK